MELCQLESPVHKPEEISLPPLLRNPKAKRERPAITSYGFEVFSATDERYRYIQYPNGDEDLYDHKSDPNEFNNIAENPELVDVIRRFKKWRSTAWAESLGGGKG